jgi:hypothetical protein
MKDAFDEMNDKEVLNWFYERLKYIHKEIEESTYMKRLSSIIDKMPRI